MRSISILIRSLFDSLLSAALIGIAVVSLLFASASPAYAYVDPSVMTYTIQALAGVAVALSALAGVVFRRARKKIFAVLKIDENRGKEVEPKVIRISPEEAKSCSKQFALSREPYYQLEKHRQKRTRMLYALCVAACMVFTVFFVAPIEIVGGNSNDFIFTVGSILPVIALASIVLTVLIALILFLIPKKAFHIACLVVFSLGAYAYLQVMTMNQALPNADGSKVIWSNYDWITLMSALVLIAVIVIPQVVNRINQGLASKICVGFCALLITMQAAGVGSILVDDATSQEEKAPKVYVTEKGLYELSPNNNVIVFVLDTIDQADFENMIVEYPDMLDEFSGFTVFSDPSGQMIPTACSLPFMLTGNTPDRYDSVAQWRKQRYADSIFLDEISESGYDIGLYSDTLCFDQASADVAKQKSTLIENVSTDGQTKMDAFGTVGVLWKCALYRDAPWFAKRFFWFYTDEVNDAMVTKDSESGADQVSYSMNDSAYYEKLCAEGLSFDDGDSKGSFKMIHLVGGHFPYNMGPNGEFIGVDESNQHDQIRGTFVIVSEYLRQMKELGIYDNATIIVTADHGNWQLVEELDFASVPILFVKEPGSDGAWVASDAPVDHSYIAPTVMNAVSGNTGGYGDDLLDPVDPNRIRTFYWLTSDGKNNLDIVEYQINGEATDFNNWTKTGQQWEWG